MIHALKYQQGLFYSYTGRICSLLRLPLASDLLRVWRQSDSPNILDLRNIRHSRDGEVDVYLPFAPSKLQAILKTTRCDLGISRKLPV